MSETRGISAQVAPELHAKVKDEHTGMGITISQYITLVLEEHFNGKERKSMASTKTLALQVEEALMNRINSYLEKHPGLSKKDFVTRLIEKELDAFEAAMAVETGELET